MLLIKEMCGGMSLAVLLVAFFLHAFTGHVNGQTSTQQMMMMTTDTFLDDITTAMTVDSNSTDSNATKAPSSGGPPRKFVPFWQFDAAVHVERIGGAILVVLGIIGNALSFFILNKKRMRVLPSSLYLRVVTFTDLWVILLGQVARHWTRAITGIDSAIEDVWYCRVWYLFVPTLTLYSNYTLMAVTVERAIAIAFPFKAMTLLANKRYGKIYLIVSLICIAIYYCYGFYFYEITMGPRGEDCIVVAAKNPTFVITVRPWLEFTISSLIPGGVILIGNCIIIATVRNASKNSFVQGESKDPEKEKEKAKQMQSMIVMLLTISFAYILLTTPFRVAFIMNVTFDSSTRGTAKRGADMRFLWAVAIFCFYLNHAINFLLYIASGREFRFELIKLCYKIVGKTPPSKKKRTTTDVSSKNISSGVTKETALNETKVVSTVSNGDTGNGKA